MVVVGRGLSPSLKVGCQVAPCQEEDAKFFPTWAAGRELPVGSRITIPPDARGEVFAGVSPGTLEGGPLLAISFLCGPMEGEESDPCSESFEVMQWGGHQVGTGQWSRSIESPFLLPIQPPFPRS